ncbi:hypothetical protein [Salaquimonas pukyongi]|uniref:hypothetical protein n=1 Tax=Salaquimonas pukyongi TaxID=2712698 RepID=UPI00096B945F|nr:hypothetical protein [Salaquimonas pukyongi]
MIATFTNCVAERESILAEACGKLASDLRLIDPLSYANFFHLSQSPGVYEDICRLVMANFPSGSMQFSCSGDALIAWSGSPVVAIDLEFSDDSLHVFFRLVLNGEKTAVELHHIAFQAADGGEEPQPQENNQRLLNALQSARRAA